MNIVIPSAKIVPVELQNLGKLPAVIYPVNQRIVFDYIHEQYKEADFIVVCYENAEEVKLKLSRYNDTKIINLDTLKDLGYSIYCGIKDMTGKGIINFADTIVMDEWPTECENAFFYAQDDFSSTWTFFEELNGVIHSIIDKKQNNKSGRGNLFVGVFKFNHLEYLASCLEEALKNPQNEINSFYYALQLYSRKYKVTPVKTENWLDIGHADKYYNSQLEVKARVFNHIKIDKDRGILTKSSDDVEKFIGEIKWYLKLPTDIEYVRPRIFNYSMEYSAPYVSMEYYAYHTVHELFLYGDLTRNQWNDIFKRISFVCSDFRRYTVKEPKIFEALEEMYLTKTLKRLKQLENISDFKNFFTHEIIINGKKFLSLNDIIKKLKNLIPAMLFNVNEFCIIHGDLCFSNIMIDNNFSFIKLIDPRGKFGKFDIYGDQRYEFAKLLHSVEGKYDFIIKDLFEVNFNVSVPLINFKINDNKRDFDIYRIFLEVFENEIENLKTIELIESLLFFSMIPLHGESIKHQMVMLATACEILSKVEKITL